MSMSSKRDGVCNPVAYVLCAIVSAKLQNVADGITNPIRLWSPAFNSITENIFRKMKPSIALQLHRVAVREATRQFRTANPRVFGSVAQGTDHDGSDLDLLVDTLPGATLFDLGGLQVDLEELLGVSVDLLTPGDLPPKFRDKILSEARPV